MGLKSLASAATIAVGAHVPSMTSITPMTTLGMQPGYIREQIIQPSLLTPSFGHGMTPGIGHGIGHGISHGIGHGITPGLSHGIGYPQPIVATERLYETQLLPVATTGSYLRGPMLY
eukprot:Gregarina_sp_Poly_1__2544@NODE_168_length_12074_cov_98_169901_g149_i0_p12_GENE_NODE_168_length_12074_cov_98_169901_g149_i0NODE_168_length_12074_cov_98_169901_g149_i0_p12_ORF_typecomplete_len117_score0_96KRTAP/PF11759_8/0_0062FeADH/PF00465_19/0_21_NODE_168_length_12074_cov_98_169901_g149_i070467396